MKTDKLIWKFNARISEDLREKMQKISVQQERSMNYLICKAIQEFISRNSEAPATRNS
ncbi:TPA: Arc family DNA-binding protein [Yersinia enterocolitica]|nr:Arc family DNA-binding protein [Yersinia enterocolitica]